MKALRRRRQRNQQRIYSAFLHPCLDTRACAGASLISTAPARAALLKRSRRPVTRVPAKVWLRPCVCTSAPETLGWRASRRAVVIDHVEAAPTGTKCRYQPDAPRVLRGLLTDARTRKVPARIQRWLVQSA